VKKEEREKEDERKGEMRKQISALLLLFLMIGAADTS